MGGEKNGQRRIRGTIKGVEVEETTMHSRTVSPIHRARKRRREEYEYPGLRVKVWMGNRSSEGAYSSCIINR